MVERALTAPGLDHRQGHPEGAAIPNACKDRHERLRVGAAVGNRSRQPTSAWRRWSRPGGRDRRRQRHGHSGGVLDTVRWIKRHYPEVQVIGGNIATGEAAKAWSRQGRTPSRPGSVRARSARPRRDVVGVPQLTAFSEVAAALGSSGVQ